MSEMAITVEPVERLNVLLDEPDNRILECALEGDADKIVTGDKAMLSLSAYETVEIISLRSYLSFGEESH